MTQGYPLAMVAYGIGDLPLIKNLKSSHHVVNQPCKSYNTGDIIKYNNIKLYFNFLKHSILGRGYYPKSTKIVQIVHTDNLETQKQFGLRHGFKVFTGARYLGSVIRDNNYEWDCLQDYIDTWENNIYTISETAVKYPQERYATVFRAIQSK